MSEIIKTLEKAYSIRLGDKIQHPVFGELQVIFIHKKEEDYEVFCNLLDFNNTLKPFDGLDLTRIKFKRRTLLKVIK